MIPSTGPTYVVEVLAEARHIAKFETRVYPVEFHADTAVRSNIGVAWRHVGAPFAQGDSGPVGPVALHESDIIAALAAIAADGLAVAL